MSCDTTRSDLIYVSLKLQGKEIVGKITEDTMAQISPKLVEIINLQISVKSKHRKQEEHAPRPIIIQLLEASNKKTLRTDIEKKMTHCEQRKENKYGISWEKRNCWLGNSGGTSLKHSEKLSTYNSLS